MIARDRTPLRPHSHVSSSPAVIKLPANLATDAYQVAFEDGSKLDYERLEVVNALDVRKLSGWLYAKEAVHGAFDYLKRRLTDDPTVEEPYKLAQVYAFFKSIRAFDPGFVKNGKLTPAHIDTMTEIPWLDGQTVLLLQSERSEYVAAVKASTLSFDSTAMKDFSDNVLTFWRAIGSQKECKLPTWRDEARRAFCVTPNSAAAERVLSVLERTFDSSQESSLSDYIETAVMLEYNKRVLG